MHVKERLHFFSIARGSLEESIRHLRRAKERNLVTALEVFTLYELMIKLSKAPEHFVETQTPRGLKHRLGGSSGWCSKKVPLAAVPVSRSFR
jgi:hypothetical protein